MDYGFRQPLLENVRGTTHESREWDYLLLKIPSRNAPKPIFIHFYRNLQVVKKGSNKENVMDERIGSKQPRGKNDQQNGGQF
jgi:hypothetical protein